MKPADYLRLLTLAAIWGASFLFMRIAVPTLGAFNTAFLRVLCASLGLAVIMVVLRKNYAFDGKFRAVLLLGIINSAIPFMMYCLAAQVLPAGYSAILNATTPIMGALIGASFFQERLTLKNIIGMLAGFSGILLITSTGAADNSHHLVMGVLACLVATGCYGLAGFLTKRWIGARGGLDATKAAIGSQFGATLFLLPFFAFSASQTPAANWTHLNAWLSVLAVGFICTALAYILYFRLIANVGPMKAMTVTFLIPPFGILWGWLVLGETLNSGFASGALLICLAVWLIVSKPRASVVAVQKS